MERLTNHFNYCRLLECQYYDEELEKENKCKYFDNSSRERCHDKAMFEKLRDYEDLEEQGLLLKLPCKVGDKAYHVIEDNIANPPIYISEHEIQDVSAKSVYFADDWWSFEEMREMNAFLNKEEAEAKLKELGDK